MKLTGKAKKSFEKWYLNLPDSMGLNYGIKSLTMKMFYCLPESMQWGIYQDWVDSLGYELYISKERSLVYFWSVGDLNKDFGEGYSKTIHQARIALIEKTNEFINEQKVKRNKGVKP